MPQHLQPPAGKKDKKGKKGDVDHNIHKYTWSRFGSWQYPSIPRQGRLDAPGTLHRAMTNGIEEASTLGDDKDRECFLSRVGEIMETAGTRPLAWTRMDNHFACSQVRRGRDRRWQSKWLTFWDERQESQWLRGEEIESGSFSHGYKERESRR